MSSPAITSRHTAGFPGLLNELGISLLVSTYQAGMLFTVRAQGENLNTHFTALERPMGLAREGEKLSVGTLAGIVSYRNLPAVSPHVEPPNTHDACYLPRGVHVTGVIDAHELAYGDEGLWLVNTKMSCLCTLASEYSVVPRWRPGFVSGYDISDRCHLNGLAMRDGKPAYVTALGATDRGEEWRENLADGGVVVDVATGETIAGRLCAPHSPRWRQGRIWLLESGKGEVGFLEGNGMSVVARLPGFTRGLEFVDRFAFIGLSRLRESSGNDLPLAGRVAKRECGVWVVDTVTGQCVAFLVFSSGVEEVFALTAMPHRSPAILDFDHPLVQTSYALPDSALADFQV